MAGQNHLQNLTIIADDDGVTTPANGVNNMPAYGIHFDISSRYENLDWKVQGRSVVKNCRVIAKHQHAVGQGLWTDTFSIWDDCEFYSPNNVAFRSHSYMPAGAIKQRFLMRNCIVKTDLTNDVVDPMTTAAKVASLLGLSKICIADANYNDGLGDTVTLKKLWPAGTMLFTSSYEFVTSDDEQFAFGITAYTQPIQQFTWIDEKKGKGAGATMQKIGHDMTEVVLSYKAATLVKIA